MKKLQVFVLLFLSFLSVTAQNITIKGEIVDSKTKEALPGVYIKVDQTPSAVSDLSGKFILHVAAGRHTLEFTFVGYNDFIKEIKVSEGDSANITISFVQKSEELDIVVVTGSKFKRQLSKETTSIEVLRADQIKATNAVTLAEALNRVPGVTMVDDQPTIRSGSGYSYGVGSRVLVLVDELPVITADRGDIRWSNIPLEIVEQVEVLKASSSALYGASALNGAINVRTKFPREEPETQASIFYHVYANPRNDAMKWWGTPNAENIDQVLPIDTTTGLPDTSVHLDDPKLLPPMRYGAFFSHARKINRFDIVIGGALEKERGYIRLNDRQFVRMVGKFRHRPERFERLSYGMNFGMMDSRETDFFLWKNPAWGAYIPNGSVDYDDRGTLALANRQNITLDPYVIFFDRGEGKHTIRARYNRLAVQFTSNYPIAHIFYGDYQYQKKFPRIFTLTAGVSGEHDIVHDREVFGNHKLSKGSLFTQVDMDFKKLLISAGGRTEAFGLDNTDTIAATFKVGLNYQAGKRTYLRLNAGLGYRFPSIAEFFANAGIEGFTIFPNPDLLPEYGGSGELGIKQGIQISKWLGYIDLALFWQEYYEMIEFTLDYYPPDPNAPFDLKYIGFKSLNISRARIAGYELSFVGEGSFGKIPVRTFGGYTFTYPVELNAQGGDETLNNLGNYLPRFFKSMVTIDDDILSGLLRYRYRHTVKADVEVDLSKFTVGTEFQYYSFVEKIDDWLITPLVKSIEEMDLQNYRTKQQERRMQGNIFWNLRGAYNFDKYGKISVIVNNVINRESSYRPAKMDPPLNFVFQYSIKI